MAARLVEGIDPSIEVRRIQARFPSAEALDAIRSADYVFGCFDHDGPQFVLNETCLAYEKPLFDRASDVPEARAYGGRVTIVWGAGGCLQCRGVLDARYVPPSRMCSAKR
ncbi:MAG: ThiF family adenylyltransferase [Candidatus Binatia bacterium]